MVGYLHICICASCKPAQQLVLDALATFHRHSIYSRNQSCIRLRKPGCAASTTGRGNHSTTSPATAFYIARVGVILAKDKHTFYLAKAHLLPVRNAVEHREKSEWTTPPMQPSNYNDSVPRSYNNILGRCPAIGAQKTRHHDACAYAFVSLFPLIGYLLPDVVEHGKGSYIIASFRILMH
jgi:hypothetical protein